MSSLERVIKFLLVLSVFAGVLLLLQLWVLVPRWLFYTVLVGWIAYLLTAAAVILGHRMAYGFALVLAIITLAVSLPRPEHVAFLRSGVNLASMTFVVGSVLQVCVIVTVAWYILKSRLHQTK